VSIFWLAQRPSAVIGCSPDHAGLSHETWMIAGQGGAASGLAIVDPPISPAVPAAARRNPSVEPGRDLAGRGFGAEQGVMLPNLNVLTEVRDSFAAIVFYTARPLHRLFTS